jgi:predicted polyphosphate/ATP-dependent NAD kinase
MTYKERYDDSMEKIDAGFDLVLNKLKEDPVLIVIDKRTLKAIQKKLKCDKIPVSMETTKYGWTVAIDYNEDAWAPLVINRSHFESVIASGASPRWQALRDSGAVT